MIERSRNHKEWIECVRWPMTNAGYVFDGDLLILRPLMTIYKEAIVELGLAVMNDT